MHCEILPSKKQSISLYYYVVPLNENMQIDWIYLNEIFENFLQNFVYEEENTPNNLNLQKIYKNLEL